MSALYREDELFSTGDYLRAQFGKDLPERHEQAQWRLAEMRQFHKSPIFAIRNYLHTADKEGNLTKIEPFIGQAVLDLCIESQRRKGLPQRVVEIKPRQVGWTTWNLGRALHNTLQPNRKSLVLVNDEDVANDLATRLGTMVNGLPAWMQPKRRIQNLKHMVFDNPNPKERVFDPGLNSTLQITVPSSMRGITPSFVVISEFAFMDSARTSDVVQGLISAMPLSEHSCVMIDTTPNGFDDFYYPMVMEAVEDNPKWIRRIETTRDIVAADVFAGKLGEPDHPERGFVPAFAPWRLHEQYTTRDDNPRGELPRLKKVLRDEIESDLGKHAKYGGDEELELRDKYGCTIQRLYWRRRKIDSYKLPTSELRLLTFRQEYCNTVESMFVHYEDTPFDRECLDIVARQGREPIATGVMDTDDNGKIGVRRSSSDWHQVRIYAPPEQGEQYSMGVDCGIAYESPTSDATVAQVVRFRDNKVVATYEARVPEHELRKQLYLLYRWYNHAYLGVETKGIGYQLIRTLIDMGVRNFYQWKRLDADIPEPTRYPGWETNSKTRPIMDSTLVELICQRNQETNRPEPDIIIPDRKTLKELQSVTRGSTGAIKAQNGHDDHVDALAIALCIARDPWGGFHRKNDGPSREERRDFNRLFAEATRFGRGSTHNQPDLANI